MKKKQNTNKPTKYEQTQNIRGFCLVRLQEAVYCNLANTPLKIYFFFLTEEVVFVKICDF